MRRFVLMCLLLFSLSMLVAGCGQGGTVSGKIYYKGQPVKGGTIYFYPEGKSGNYASVIERDGSFTISKLPPGPVKISVVVGTRAVPTEAFAKQRAGKVAVKGMKEMERIGGAASGGGEEPGNAAGPKEKISVPDKYADPEKSGLTIDVTGGRQTHDIQLE
jgi:hypothetical protein